MFDKIKDKGHAKGADNMQRRKQYERANSDQDEHEQEHDTTILMTGNFYKQEPESAMIMMMASPNDQNAYRSSQYTSSNLASNYIGKQTSDVLKAADGDIIFGNSITVAGVNQVGPQHQYPLFRSILSNGAKSRSNSQHNQREVTITEPISDINSTMIAGSLASAFVSSRKLSLSVDSLAATTSRELEVDSEVTYSRNQRPKSTNNDYDDYDPDDTQFINDANETRNVKSSTDAVASRANKSATNNTTMTTNTNTNTTTATSAKIVKYKSQSNLPPSNEVNTAAEKSKSEKSLIKNEKYNYLSPLKNMLRSKSKQHTDQIRAAAVAVVESTMATLSPTPKSPSHNQSHSHHHHHHHTCSHQHHHHTNRPVIYLTKVIFIFRLISSVET